MDVVMQVSKTNVRNRRRTDDSRGCTGQSPSPLSHDCEALRELLHAPSLYSFLSCALQFYNRNDVLTAYCTSTTLYAERNYLTASWHSSHPNFSNISQRFPLRARHYHFYPIGQCVEAFQ